MNVVISLGGSILVKDNFHNLKNLVEFFKSISNEHRLCIVTGGGKYAREYINAGRLVGLKDYQLDEIAIELTRANAFLLSRALGEMADQRIYENEEEARDAFFNSNKIIVMGGTIPGQSTDSVASKLADEINADLLINASDIEGVYNEDPKKNKNAKLYKKLNYNDFREIIKKNPQSPGNYALFDLKAIDIIESNKIKTYMVDGNNVENLKKALKGEYVGTIIYD